MGKNIGLLRRIWNGLFDRMLEEEEGGTKTIVVKGRALSIPRLYDQLWLLLNPDDSDWGDWAWPNNIYVDEVDLFAIYSRGGNLYRVALFVSGDTLSIGSAIQVTEAFPAVQQSRGQFFVRRQADGKYRWVMIAGTTVLNRQGELDSSELFDCFVSEIERTGEYPRLDFYHLGGDDPEVWEFGTADYVARDGVCYIATGTFDDHPLAGYTIAAAEREPDRWGASIEFRTIEEAELVKVHVGDEAEPLEIKIPIYRKGKNTRISVLLEQDAAGLFTTLGVSREVIRMRGDILQKLTELCGDEEEARKFVEEFGVEVDRVNTTVKEQGLIHRGKKAAAATKTQAAADPGDDDEEDDDDEGEGQADVLPPLELDEEAVRAISEEVLRTELFQSMHTAINAVSEQLTALTEINESRQARIDQLEKRSARMAKRIEVLERGEAQKQQQWLEDLPASRSQKVSFRPRDAHKRNMDENDEEGGEDEPESMAASAERTLDTLPAW